MIDDKNSRQRLSKLRTAKAIEELKDIYRQAIFGSEYASAATKIVDENNPQAERRKPPNGKL